MTSARCTVCILLLFVSAPAFASYACTGPVVGVHVNGNGLVAVESIGTLSWPYFCALGQTTSNGVGPEACKGLLALLLTAQASGKQVKLWFDDGLTCSTHPSWNYLSGWYWGPEIVD